MLAICTAMGCLRVDISMPGGVGTSRVLSRNKPLLSGMERSE